MRLFLAVIPPEDFRQELSRQVDELREALADDPALRWTRPQTWHLTLQFLGDWPQERLGALEGALHGGISGRGFTLQPGELGAFPDLRRPRVLFLHLEEEVDTSRAAELAGQVRSAVSEVWSSGPQDGKPFRPHLTLARLKVRLEPGLGSGLEGWRPGPLPPWPVRAVQLMASELQPTGAVHRVLRSFPLEIAPDGF